MATEKLPADNQQHLPNQQPPPIPHMSTRLSPADAFASPSPHVQVAQYARKQPLSNHHTPHHVAQPPRALIRTHQSHPNSRNLSRRPSERTLAHHQSNSYAHSRTASHLSSPLIASPQLSHFRDPSLSAHVSYVPDTRSPTYDHWAAGVSPIHKLKSYHSPGKDVEASPILPQGFQSIGSGEGLIISTRKTYDLEVLNSDEKASRASQAQTFPGLVSIPASYFFRIEQLLITLQVHLSLSAFLLSVGITVYTLLALLLAITTSPLCLCHTSSSTLRESLIIRLLPPLNFQRRCIFADPIVPHTPSKRHLYKSRTESSAHATFNTSNQARSTSPTHQPVKPSSLIFTHLLSPFIALPLTVCAWIMALAWLLSAMIAHEQTAGASDDEQRMAESLVGFWFWWLDCCRIDEEEEVTVEEQGRRAVGDRGRARERRRRSSLCSREDV